MLSAFTHQIQELEKKFDQQNEELFDIKSRQYKLESTSSFDSGCECKSILDNLQSQVNTNYFRINDLSTRFDQLEVNVSADGSEMTDVSAFVEDSPSFSPAWKAPGSREPTPSQVPDGYESPPLGSYTAKEFFAAASFANISDAVNNNTIRSSPATVKSQMSETFPKKNPWSFDNPKIKEPPQKQQSRGFGFGDQQQQLQKKELKTFSAASKSSFTSDNITSFAAENSHLKQQILTYRQKTSDLEDKLKTSESSVEDLRMIREHFVQKEREWNQRVEWYDHKLKLLKQDKRRRGETIGKLLKCIDDLKDTGRLDESRVKDGRAVLSATLGSYGLHPEERIVRVVEAVEHDRASNTIDHDKLLDSLSDRFRFHRKALPRTPTGLADTVGDCPSPDTQNIMLNSLANENKNNSSFCNPFEDLSEFTESESDFLTERHGLLPIEHAEFLAEKHGFIPIDHWYDIDDVEMT